MSEFYWPAEKGIHRVYFTAEQRLFSLPWQWDGEVWSDPECLAVRRTADEMIANGYLGVRREPEKPIIARVTLRDGGEHKPPRNALAPDPDDGNAMVAQQALDEWRACKQQPKAADWAYRWAVDLCERLGAR
jgi:hypothetical protein